MVKDYTKEEKAERIKYCNSMERDIEQIVAFLTLGFRTPQNDWERRVLEQINEIEAKGGMVDIPFD